MKDVGLTFCRWGWVSVATQPNQEDLQSAGAEWEATESDWKLRSEWITQAGWVERTTAKSAFGAYIYNGIWKVKKIDFQSLGATCLAKIFQ